ncbi:leukotriene B4 receptor 1-like [Alosa pseudoharengus]|uniref:leukotriene B4 receptor 1-like n=1 Tax=Alosa pseudoharengus TaxID=34774 RepID=UPI003F8964D8
MQQLNITSISSTAPVSLGTQVASAMLGCCCALGVPGNLVVLAVLRRRLAGGNFTLWLMLNLSVSDLLTLLTLPVWIYTLCHGWSLGLVPCKLLSYLVYWSLYTSVLCVTLLSVQRYIQVLYPQRWAELKSPGRKILLGLVWALGGILSCHALVQREVILEGDGRLHCLQHYRSDGEQVTTLLLESLLLFVLPFSILASLYISLHRRVTQTIRSGHERMKKLVVSIIVVFFIFSIPIHLNNLFTVVAVSLRSHDILQFSKVTKNAAGALTFINSCVNPFLYAFSHRELRQSTAMPLNPALSPNNALVIDPTASSNL